MINFLEIIRTVIMAVLFCVVFTSCNEELNCEDYECGAVIEKNGIAKCIVRCYTDLNKKSIYSCYNDGSVSWDNNLMDINLHEVYYNLRIDSFDRYIVEDSIFFLSIYEKDTILRYDRGVLHEKVAYEKHKGTPIFPLDTTCENGVVFLDAFITVPNFLVDSIIVIKNSINEEELLYKKINSRNIVIPFDTTISKKWIVSVSIFTNRDSKLSFRSTYSW